MFLRIISKTLIHTHSAQLYRPLAVNIASLRRFSKDTQNNKSNSQDPQNVKEKVEEVQQTEQTEQTEQPIEAQSSKPEIQNEYTIMQRKIDALKQKNAKVVPSTSETTEEEEDHQKASNSESMNEIKSIQLPPEDDAYGDIVYALEYSDSVYVPEESKQKIYELYVERHWDTKKISQTLKIAEDRVIAIIKLRDRHERFIKEGRYNKHFVEYIEELNQYENRERGNKINLAAREDSQNKKSKDQLIQNQSQLPSYIPQFVFINEDQSEKDVRDRIIKELDESKKRNEPILLKRTGIQLDRFTSTVTHKRSNHHTNVILCNENNERVLVDNKKDMNRSWNRYKYRHRNLLEDVQLKELPKEDPISNS